MIVVFLPGLLRAASRLLLCLGLCVGLSACGGSDDTHKSSFSSPSGSSSSATGSVILSGSLSYDFVPHNANNIGLNYAATEARPIRGAIVELLNANAEVVDATQSDVNGLYQFTLAANTQVRVRVKAQLLKSQTPSWNVSVNDNTRNNALYSMAGALASSGTSDSQRHLHALSGWSGAGYTSERVAAPFAIIDTLYQALLQLESAGLMLDLPPLQFRWSTANIAAANPHEDYSSGEIGTSFYNGEAIYLLGEANSDTDEYDAHIVLHEWIHYLEDVLARTDSLGGGHGYGDRLDMRVALSEGLANAMSAILLDDPQYRDALGVQQSEGFAYDVATRNHLYRGWYNEASIESIFYNYYLSSTDKTTRNLADILQVFTAGGYAQTPGFISIFAFVHHLKLLHPTHAQLLDSLLGEQLIYGTGIYGADEINDGGESFNLPVYKPLAVNGTVVNVCSSSAFGRGNKLGVAQFLSFTISRADTYQVRVEKNGGNPIATDPDFAIYRAGALRWLAESVVPNQESASINLQAGQYVMEVYDFNNRNIGNESSSTTCFDVRIIP